MARAWAPHMGSAQNGCRLVTGQEWGKSQGDGTRRVDEWSRKGMRQADLTRGDVGDESVRCAKFIRFIYQYRLAPSDKILQIT
jgi:hypothetical protein